jgi:hypothetical protein
LDVFFLDVYRHSAEGRFVELLGPVRQSYPLLEGIESLLLIEHCLELTRNHRHSHRQSHQVIHIGFFECLAGVVDISPMDGAGIKEDQISCLAFHQLACSH